MAFAGFCITLNDLAELTAAIDIALDGAAGDGQLGLLGSTQLGPPCCGHCFAIQVCAASHAASEDVAALGVQQTVV